VQRIASHGKNFAVLLVIKIRQMAPLNETSQAVQRLHCCGLTMTSKVSGKYRHAARNITQIR